MDSNKLQRGSKRPRFYFAGKAIHRTDCIVFSRQQQPEDEICQRPHHLVGYFHYQEVTRRRWQKLQPRRHPRGGRNIPGQGLSLKKLSDITPKDWSRDPYLLCVLISMVQSQKYDHEPLQRTVPTVCRLLQVQEILDFGRVCLNWCLEDARKCDVTNC